MYQSSVAYFGVYDASNAEKASGTFGTVLDGSTWRMLTVVAKANSYQMHMDGVMIHSSASGTGIPTKTTTLNYIGKSSWANEATVDMLELRYMAVWMSPFSQGQLDSLHSNLRSSWSLGAAPASVTPSYPASVPAPYLDFWASGAATATPQSWPNMGRAGSSLSFTAASQGKKRLVWDANGKPYLELAYTYMSLAGSLLMDATSGWTILATVRAPASGAWNERVYEFAGAMGEVNSVQFYRSGFGSALKLVVQDNYPDTVVDTTSGATFDNTWKTIIITFLANEYKVLVDGVQVGGGGTAGINTRTTTLNYIGKSSVVDDTTTPALLQLRQMSMWSTALNDTTLASLHNYVAQAWAPATAPDGTWHGAC